MWIFSLLATHYVESLAKLLHDIFMEPDLFTRLASQMLRCQGLQQRKSLFTRHISEEMREKI